MFLVYVVHLKYTCLIYSRCFDRFIAICLVFAFDVFFPLQYIAQIYLGVLSSHKVWGEVKRRGWRVAGVVVHHVAPHFCRMKRHLVEWEDADMEASFLWFVEFLWISCFGAYASKKSGRPSKTIHFLELYETDVLKRTAEVKELEQQKREFLVSCLPGMKEVKRAGGHSSANCFHQERHAEGKLLLKQGATEEQIIFVIVSGTVELVRNKRGDAKDILATLEPGDMFGSFGSSFRMPFSARVTTKSCEVLSARSRDIELLPEKVVGQIMAQLSADTAERLRKSCVFRGMGWQKQMQNRSRSETDHAADLLALNSRDLRMHLSAHLWSKWEKELENKKEAYRTNIQGPNFYWWVLLPHIFGVPCLSHSQSALQSSWEKVGGKIQWGLYSSIRSGVSTQNIIMLLVNISMIIYGPIQSYSEHVYKHLALVLLNMTHTLLWYANKKHDNVASTPQGMW